MNTKLLVPFVGLALMASGVSYATFAFFADAETVTQNIFTGATLDLTTDDAQGITASIGDAAMVPGASTSGSITLKNAGTLLSGTVLDVKFETDGLPAGAVWDEQQKSAAGDPAADDEFGYSIALDGDTMVVGARYDDDGGADSGSAYVFTTSNGGVSWTQQQKLAASDAAGGDSFGFSVDVSGDTVIVGAYLSDGAGADGGAAYVFTRSGSTWTQQQKLTGSDTTAGDWFGYGVAVDGDTVAIGSTSDDEAAGVDQGSTYVFTRTGSVWSEQQKLTASDAAASDFFGENVALDGDTLVVGASLDDDAAGSNQGAAYVFTRAGSVWSQQQRLTPADASGSDYFGHSVTLSGDTAIVSAHYDDGPAGVDQGSAYVFTRSGTTWTEQQKLTPADAVAGDVFGWSVAVEGDTAVIGSRYDGAAATNGGSAYVFTRSGSTWTQVVELTGADTAVDDHFGFAVALSGDVLVAGAYGDDDAASSSGSAYAFKLVGGGTDLAQWLIVTALTYDGGALALPGDLDGDGRANSLADLNQFGVFTGLASPGAIGKDLDMTVELEAGAGNEVQGLSEDLTIRFLLRQSGAPSL